jgi:TonB family protein
MTFGARFSPRIVSRLVLCCLFAGFLIVIVAGGVASAGNKPVWIELRSPHFIVVTNAGEGKARRAAYQFEMIRAVFRSYFGQKQESVEQPVMLLAAKDENTIKGLVPEFWARKGAAHPAGYYLGSSDTDYIVLRLDVSLNTEAYEPFEPVYHEYVHYLTRHLISHLPLWMVEGLAEFYGNTQIKSKDVYVGAPSTTNILILRQQKALPVSTLFEIDASSPYYHEQNKTSIFYAESWALTHYLVTRDWKENTHRVADFIKQLEKGGDPKTVASQTIGDANVLDDPLRKYIGNVTFTAVKIQPPNIDENGFRVRDMRDAEALAVRADFMAHDRHYADAQQMLQDALKVDPNLGIACDGLSFLALQQGKTDEAEKWSSQALALDPQDYRANYYYAWSLLKSGRIDNESLDKAEASLRTVLKGNPEFVPAYDAMAYVLNLQGGKEKLDEAYMMTLQAVSREPGNVQYRIRGVEVLERQQRADDAVRVATLAVSMAKTPAEQQAASAALAGAQQFQESWKKFQAMQAAQAASGNVDAAEVPTRGALNLMRQVNASVGVVILSNTQGVDFNSYLSSEVMSKIQREWAAQIQNVSAEAASKDGKVIVEFAIGRDGSIGDIQLKQSTQDHELDAAVQGAIQSASPFAPLPAKFRGKNLVLRFQCDYKQGAAAGPGTAGRGSATDGKKEDGGNAAKN